MSGGGRERIAGLEPGPALALVALLAACAGGGGPPPPVVPARRPTAGDALLGLAPAGADAVLEVDLRRVRDNAALGPLARALLPIDAGAGEPARLTSVDALVLVSYGLGEGAPRVLLLARGGAAARLPDATAVGRDAVAIGDAVLIRRALAVVGGHEPGLTSDRELLALRAAAMPAAAPSAAARLTARLSFEARLAMARRLGLDAVPRTISLWADVVDDVAVIALLGADRATDAAPLRRASEQLVARLARSAPLVGRTLARELGRTRVTARGAEVRFTLVIGPRRLAGLVGRALRILVPRPRSSALVGRSPRADRIVAPRSLGTTQLPPRASRSTRCDSPDRDRNFVRAALIAEPSQPPREGP